MTSIQRPGRARKPGRVPLWLALAAGVVGMALVVVGSVLLATGLLSRIDGFARVPIGGSTQSVQLERTGPYVGYLETPVTATHRAAVEVRITDPAGRAVALDRYAANTTLTYTRNGRFGQALITFTATSPGRYEVTARSADAPRGSRLALGESIANGLVTGIVLVVVGGLLVAAAVVLLIVGIVRRTSYNKRMRARGPEWGYQH